jgi:hypothetical protein
MGEPLARPPTANALAEFREPLAPPAPFYLPSVAAVLAGRDPPYPFRFLGELRRAAAELFDLAGDHFLWIFSPTSLRFLGSLPPLPKIGCLLRHLVPPAEGIPEMPR